MNKNHHVVIMAGGIGSRFWPMSRTHRPKQFLDVLDTGRTLIQQTWDRFETLVPKENIWVVTNSSYLNWVNTQLPEMSQDRILLEPMGRNTAPCVAYAAFRIHQVNPKAKIVVAASDHLILQGEKFGHDILTALDSVGKSDMLMTLGIKPTRPDTGYGYIQYVENKETPDASYFKVKTFTEKPTLEIAQSFLQSGDFLWNSGIFIFSAKTILKSFEEYMPELFELFSSIRKKLDTPDETDAIAEVYARCKNISIDNGIMELAQNVYVIPGDFGWSDLGTWVSLYQQYEKDYLGNAVSGKGKIYGSSGNMIRCEHPDKLVLIEGLENYIVVDTDNVLLICKMSSEQKIKEFVGDVKKEKKEGENYV
ncbi:MAG: mannose-1-phosphate guanylyltransferase [Sphingobacteriia bacterium]|nr:mannose-1-phosphate guanylyltransferase [Sphingobacteriia bacterium]